jgi:cation diffusion facilitator family transporter
MKTVHKVASLSIGVNILLFVFKLAIALYSGSVSLLADAIHSSTDVISSIALLIGIRISGRKSRQFPFGLYKVENLISLGIAFLIFLAGYEIIREVFFENRGMLLIRPATALATAAASALITYFYSFYVIKKGRQENSPAIIADGRHIRVDAFTSLVVAIGLAGRLLNIAAEKGATLLVAAFILKSGWDILKESLRVLLDASIDPKTLEQLREIITAHPAITNIREIIGRNSGSFTFIEGNLVVKTKDFTRAHQIVEEITEEVRRRIPHIDRIVLHYEPGTKTTFLIAAMLSDGTRWLVSEHFGEAPYIGWIEIHLEKNQILRMEVSTNPYTHIEKGKGIKVAEHLAGRGVDLVLTRESFHGKGPEYVFTSQDIRVLKISEESIDTDLISKIYQEKTGRKLSKS